jgi:hypothetical protein
MGKRNMYLAEVLMKLSSLVDGIIVRKATKSLKILRAFITRY